MVDGEQRSIGKPRRSEKRRSSLRRRRCPRVWGLYHHGQETAILQGLCSERIAL
jgi:hypothetical protein